MRYSTKHHLRQLQMTRYLGGLIASDIIICLRPFYKVGLWHLFINLVNFIRLYLWWEFLFWVFQNYICYIWLLHLFLLSPNTWVQLMEPKDLTLWVFSYQASPMIYDLNYNWDTPKERLKKRKNLHMLSDFYPIYLQAGPKALFREFTLGSSTHLYLTAYSTQGSMHYSESSVSDF